MNRRDLLLASSIAAVLASIAPAEAFLLHHSGVASNALNLSLINIDASNSYAAPNVSFGHAFADGTVPSGGSVIAINSFGSQVTTQLDAIATWPSGCVKFGVVSLSCTETFAANSSINYTLAASTTAPNNTPAAGWGGSPEATIAANSNFKVVYGPGFDTANTYTVSFNTILANFSNYPWGTSYPLGGWERTKSGPLCMEWHAWQYLRNDSTTNPQGYVRCDMWVKAWSPTGPFEIDVRTSMPNIWNTISTASEQHSVSPGRFATLVVVKNGSTVLANLGGASDPRASTVANANFNTTTNRITAAAASLLPQTGCVFTSTGTLPSGIAANTIYWLAYPGGGNPNPYVMTSRLAASTIEQSNYNTWAANTGYSGSYGGSYVINNGIFYVCTTSGTSGSTGPTGTGSGITDGTCVWTSVSVPLGTQGTGTITAYPVYACFPNSAWCGGDINGDPIWSGSGSRPPVFPGHDFAYLTQKSGFTPRYNAAAGYVVSNQAVPVFIPTQNAGGLQWAQSATGDGAGDQRIGYIANDAVATLFNPSDPHYVRSAIQGALCYHQATNSFLIDESCGVQFAANNGPAKNGTSYPNLQTPVPTWASGNAPGQAKSFAARGAQWLPWSSANQDQSGYGGQYYIDTSHTPSPSPVPYLKTGRPIFMEHTVALANVDCFTNYNTAAVTSTGTNVYCVVNAVNQSIQLRAWAWALRSLCMGLFVIPDASSFKPVLADYYNDNFLFMADYFANVMPSQAATFGLTYGLDHGVGSNHGFMAPWQQYFWDMVISLEKRRGGQTTAASANISSVFTYAGKFFDYFTSNASGLYYMGLYDLTYSPNPQGYSTAYTTALGAFNATYADAKQSNLAAPYPSGNKMYDGNEPSGLMINDPYENTTQYAVIGRAALTERVYAGDSSRTTTLGSLNTLLSTITGISTTSGGIAWNGNDHGIQANYPTFAQF